MAGRTASYKRSRSTNQFPGWATQVLIGYVYSDALHRTAAYLCEGVDQNDGTKPARYLMLSKQVRTQSNPQFRVRKNLTIPYATAQQVQAIIGKAVSTAKALGW